MVSFIVKNLEKILSSILLYVLNVCLPVWTTLRWVTCQTFNRMRWEQQLCPRNAKICYGLYMACSASPKYRM